MKQGFVALAVATALAGTPLLAQNAQNAQSTQNAQAAQISGTAKDEAKKPYPESKVQLRDVSQGQIVGATALDSNGAFLLPNLVAGRYAVELLNRDGNIVCTEGPFELTAQQPIKDGVVIDCNKIPAAWWILGAAAAAGVTAGIVVANTSPSR